MKTVAFTHRSIRKNTRDAAAELSSILGRAQQPGESLTSLFREAVDSLLSAGRIADSCRIYDRYQAVCDRSDCRGRFQDADDSAESLPIDLEAPSDPRIETAFPHASYRKPATRFYQDIAADGAYVEFANAGTISVIPCRLTAADLVAPSEKQIRSRFTSESAKSAASKPRSTRKYASSADRVRAFRARKAAAKSA